MRLKFYTSIVGALCLAVVSPSLYADYSIETGKKDYFGSKKSIIKNESGRKTGEIITQKPDSFGVRKSVIRDSHGRVIGTAQTGKPDAFGRVRTVYRDSHGRVTGSCGSSFTARIAYPMEIFYFFAVLILTSLRLLCNCSLV